MSLTLVGIGIVVIFLLTGISAFFSSSELAVFSIARHRIDFLLESETPGAKELAALREDSHQFLVTVLVSIDILLRLKPEESRALGY